MKKLSCLILSIFVLFMLCSCKQKQTFEAAETLEHSVASELENIENIQDVSSETLKAMSVIVRTEIRDKSNKTEDSNIEKNYSETHNKIYEISSQTAGEVLNNTDSSTFLIEQSSNQNWNQEIKKSTLLKYLSKNNISLTNLSSVSPVLDENGNILELDIGGKKIAYSAIKDEFNLKSNKITKIDNNLASITVYGESDITPGQVLYIDEAEKLVKDGYSYKQLLKHFFNGFELITNENL